MWCKTLFLRTLGKGGEKATLLINSSFFIFETKNYILVAKSLTVSFMGRFYWTFIQPLKNVLVLHTSVLLTLFLATPEVVRRLVVRDDSVNEPQTETNIYWSLRRSRLLPVTDTICLSSWRLSSKRSMGLPSLQIRSRENFIKKISVREPVNV